MSKILLCANCAFTLTNFRKDLLLDLSKNHDVHCAFPYSSSLTEKSDIDFFNTIGVTTHNIFLSRKGVNPFVDFLTLINFIFIFFKLRPNIVLNYTIKCTVYSSLAKFFFKDSKCYSNITGLGFAFFGTTFKRKLLNIIVKLLYKVSLSFNNKVFFQNEDDMAFFVEEKILKSSLKAVLLNGSGVNVKSYFHSGCDREENSFIFVGRLLKDKGLLEYIEASNLLYQESINFKSYILGPIDENPSSLSKLDIEDIENNNPCIIYLGQSNDVSKILDTKETFVLPSYREGTSRAALEALSFGMAIITTDAPGCRSTVIDGVNGFLVKVADINDLYLAMKKIIENRSLLNTFSKNSRRLAEEKFSVEKVNAVIKKTIFNE